MKKCATWLSLCLMLVGMSVLSIGCEDEIARESETEIKDDGTVKTKEKTVTEESDGDITVKEEKTERRPGYPE